MKLISIFATFLFVGAVSQAKTQSDRQPAAESLAKSVEKAIRDGLAKEMKIKVEVAKNQSVCGSAAGDAIFATVSLKKMNMAEGGPKESWEVYDHFGATSTDFKKEGYRAFMRDNQCME